MQMAGKPRIFKQMSQADFHVIKQNSGGRCDKQNIHQQK